MEEDIKYIEWLLEELSDEGYGKQCKQAIENLIKGYKELEEENIKYERANDYLQTLNKKYYEDNVTLLRKNGKVDILADNIHFKYIDTVDNYIPKSKVREKIEELKDFENDGDDYDYIYKKGQYELCEELLQEGDK